MQHNSDCWKTTVDVEGQEKEMCLNVPGNEQIGQVAIQGKPIKATAEEIGRAVDFHFGNHQHEEPPQIGKTLATGAAGE